MRTSRIVAVSAVLAMMAATVSAAPIEGTYTSPDVLDARWTESNTGGDDSAVGDEIDAESWDGSTLGTQWVLDEAVVASEVLLDDTTSGSLRIIQDRRTYSGGVLTLKNDTTLWSGDVADGDYLVDVTNFTQSTVTTLYNGTVISTTGTLSMQGTFQNFPDYSINYLVATSETEGEGTAAPAGYPALTAANGLWGSATDVTLEIVPEPTAIAFIALGGAGVALRRRRRA